MDGGDDWLKQTHRNKFVELVVNLVQVMDIQCGPVEHVCVYHYSQFNLRSCTC